MRYLDSSVRNAQETAGAWMQTAAAEGLRDVRIQAGYFTFEGAGPLLSVLRDSKATLRLLIGSNDGCTTAGDVAALVDVLGLPRKNVSLGLASFNGSLFHSKTYHFTRRDGSQTAYIGSANLTGPAITGFNIEAGVILDSRENDSLDVLGKIARATDLWFEKGLPGLSRIRKPADVDALLAAGHLSVLPVRPQGGAGGEDGAGAATARHRLARLITLPKTGKMKPQPLPAGRAASAPRATPQAPPAYRFTDPSFHYPQGTHIGHLLSILYHFSTDRRGSAFEDQYIDFFAPLGDGRTGGFRRQIRYKMRAAMELGLLSDARLAPDEAAYKPRLTATGAALWKLLTPYVDVADLRLDGLSSDMPHDAAHYTALVRRAGAEDPALGSAVASVFLNMPAVKQLLRLLYQRERARDVAKQDIYRDFFRFGPVQAFHDAMGIKPATDESAKHRCPFLLNLLESCGVITQSRAAIAVEKLALSPDLLVADGEDIATGARRLASLQRGWPSVTGSFVDGVAALRVLFGKDFLTRRYHLKQLMLIPPRPRG